jgi:uncharacterized protein YbjT (DUF2867 family)
MTAPHLTVLVVGATGSIGRHVVAEALRRGHTVRALARNLARARDLASDAEVFQGDLTRPDTLAQAVGGIDAVVFTHGSDGGGKAGAEQVDYGGVRNVLAALAGQDVRVALMTAIGVTNRGGTYNRTTESHDWKRRAERLVRASGHPYTIVRPGWFDYNSPDEHQLVMLQGDRRWAGDPSDGAVSRQQLAEVLVASLAAPEAVAKTFELVAVRGPAPRDLDVLYSALAADDPTALDGVQDTPNQPLDAEPARVRADLDAVRSSRARPAVRTASRNAGDAGGNLHP